MAKTNVSKELAEKIIKICEAKTVKESDVEEIKDLIDRGADVNTYRYNGIPILHYTFSREIYPVVLMEKISDMVINAGFDLSFCDVKGNPALFYAVATGNSTFVKQVLGAGADINIQNRLGWTALRLAAENKDIKMAKLLIDNGADVNTQCHECEETALFAAVNNGDIEMARLLIKSGADITITNMWGQSSLAYAVNRGHKNLSKLLISKGVDTNKQDIFGEIPLHIAVFDNDKDIVRLLIRAGSVSNIVNNNGDTPLNMAIEKGYDEIIKIFVRAKQDLNTIEYGVNKVSYDPPYLEKPSDHVASEIDDYFIATHKKHAYGKLLADEGASLKISIRNMGIKALHIAVCIEREDIVRLLIKAGADVRKTDNIYGLTPLHIAAYTGNESIIKMLLESGSDINVADSQGRTPLMIMSRYGHVDILINFFKNAKILTRHIDFLDNCLEILKNNHPEAYVKFNDHIQQLQTQATLDREDVHKSDATGFEYDI